MNTLELQSWLRSVGQRVVADGRAGPQTRAAIKAAFTNSSAPAVTQRDIAGFAQRIGCPEKNVRAVASVESAGGGFTAQGQPKILFERHYFWRLTQGRFGVTSFSNSSGGGYSEDSWEKLCQAASRDPDAAFSSASWGKFQVMGAHWKKLGYLSPLEMTYGTSLSEAAHYEILVRYIFAFGLRDAVRELSTNPETCRKFAAGYNGPAYRKFDYHVKLARAMR